MTGCNCDTNIYLSCTVQAIHNITNISCKKFIQICTNFVLKFVHEICEKFLHKFVCELAHEFVHEFMCQYYILKERILGKVSVSLILYIFLCKVLSVWADIEIF